MRRWIGWGDDSIELALDAEGLAFLRQRIGRSRQFEDATLAGATDSTLERSLPRKYVSDSGYVLGETEPGLNLFGVLNKSPESAREAMTGMVAGLLRNFGAHSRAFVRSLLARSRQGPRP